MSYRPPTSSRTWGSRFDSLLASPISPPTRGTILDSTSADAATLNSAFVSPKEVKAPHDASIFVGSLPCNVDPAELGRLLSNHLAEHQEVISVKVVRDSKGGICAFVQCDDASSAASLIHTLRSGPARPFMGRILRYEPARAFRTLLVSYRTPVQVVAPSGAGERKQTVMLDLPYAMRLWKPKDSKYFNVVYNAEAVDLEKRYCGISVLDQRSDGRFFMQPMVFDGEAIRSITSFFGALECFERLELDGIAEQDTFDSTCARRHNYPFPHNSPRNACMDGSCWEVKWKHRDDCVGALMALRRIPHLTVTWAHQLLRNSTDRVAAGQEKEAKATATVIWPRALNCELTSCSLDASDSPNSGAVDNPSSSMSSRSRNSDDAKISYARSIDQQTSFDYDLQQDVDGTGNAEPVKLSWSDEDFETVIDSQEFDATRWATWQEEINQPIVENEATPVGDDQLDIVSTPGLGMSPITPRSLGSGFPSTPTDLSAELSGLSLDPKLNSSNPYNNNNVFKGKPVDPTTLFVGGLEMFGPSAWDEDKVRKCFEKYGTLENVKFVRPYNSCSAFAFVKFKSIDGPSLAIQEEHNRIYEGRAIRVQLRECNVPRGTWKPLRTRGRYTRNIDKIFDTGAQCQSQVVTASGAESMRRTESEEHSNVQCSTDVVRSESISETINPTTGSFIEPTTTQENGNGPQTQETTSGLSMTPQTNPVALSIQPFAYPSYGYYPAPWFHPYLQQIPYQFPYYAGYAGYMMPPPIPRPPHSNADANGSANVQVPWHTQTHPYGSYISYPTAQLTRSQTTDTTSYSQVPIVPGGFVQNEQAPLVTTYRPEANEQYSSETQTATGPVSHVQPNIPIWPHFSGQPYHYSAAGLLNANAKAFIPPPGTGWVPNQSGVQGLSTSARCQSVRRGQGNVASGQNRPFVGRSVRGTTNFSLSKDNRHIEPRKSTPEPTDWI